jgi:hypothetical protein
MNVNQYFEELHGKIVGRPVTDRQLAGNSLSIWIDMVPGDSGAGLTIWLDPAWNIVGPERVIAGSMQAQDEEDKSGFDAVTESIDVLVGLTVQSLIVEPITGDLVIALTEGVVVRTFASDPRDTGHWRIKDYSSGDSLIGSPSGMRLKSAT